MYPNVGVTISNLLGLAYETIKRILVAIKCNVIVSCKFIIILAEAIVNLISALQKWDKLVMHRLYLHIIQDKSLTNSMFCFIPHSFYEESDLIIYCSRSIITHSSRFLLSIS